jgi:hypothetical protein
VNATVNFVVSGNDLASFPTRSVLHGVGSINSVCINAVCYP